MWRDCPRLVVGTAAVILSILTISVIAVFPFDQTVLGVEPVSWIVAAGIVAGSGYMLLPATMAYLQTLRGGLYGVLAIGLTLRLVMMIPDPILEIDFYRYMWDGAVINAGFSPYEWSPQQVMAGQAPDGLSRLAQASAGVIEQINYPYLTTIYPPVAELVFAITNWIKPWDLMTWRLVILLFEAVTVAFLFAVLRQLGRSPLWIILYWWNPVVIIEFSNAAHMDAILLPVLLAATLAAMKSRRSIASAVCLAVATAVKLWPVLLLPTLLRSSRRVLVAGVVFAGIATALLWPFIDQALRADGGLHAYGVSWERNAALFHLMLGGLRHMLDSNALFALDAGRILRIFVGVVVVIVALDINRRAALDPQGMARRMIIVIAAILLLGPTLYPWYYTWMVPFLVIAPSTAMLAFTVVLPLYRLQFHPWFQDNSWLFTEIVVWLEQGPIFLLLFLEWRARRSP